MDASTFTIIGTVLAVGIALAGLIMRSTARVDADRRAADARFDRAMSEWRASMDAFHTEMQRLAEPQSHVEGRISERDRAAAD